MLDDDVRTALSCVYDPCSIAAGRPMSLIDMGLVTDWTFDDGVLRVTFCVTFVGCTMAPHFVEAARAELAKVKGVRIVETHVDTEHVWMPPAPITMRGKPQAWRNKV
jgi:metal-sulfur cluster biosynthetic enzyme